MSEEPPLLRINGLKKYFSQGESFIDTVLNRETEQVRAVDGVSFTITEGQSIGIVGESGCGKTTLIQTILGLNDPTAGSIYYEGQDIAEFSRQERKEYLSKIQMIFQDPYNTFNPRMTIRESLMEPLRIHDVPNKEERIYELMNEVELNPADRYLDKLPKQMSGGEKQRVSIARALTVKPNVLLADEPVSMLDVSTQAAILNLLSRLQKEYNLSLIYISHDLSTVSYICELMHVMYLGRIVETAPTNELIQEPKHPYSQALIDAIPIPDPHNKRERTQIEEPPEAVSSETEGCRFRDRCPERMEICEVTPEFPEVNPNHRVACHLHYDHESVEARNGLEPNN